MDDLFTKLKNAENGTLALSKLLCASKHPFSIQLGEVIGDSYKSVNFKKVLLHLNKINLFDSPSRQHTFFYYCTKGTLEHFTFNRETAKLSFKNAKENLQKSDPIHIRHMFTFFSSKVFDISIRHPINIKLASQLNLSNNYEFWLWRGIATDLAILGMLKIDLNDTSLQCRYLKNPQLFHEILFQNFAGKGHVHEAKKYLAKLSSKSHKTLIVHHIRMLSILENKLDRKKWKNYPFDNTVLSLVYDYYIALLNNHPQQALSLAKKGLIISEELNFNKKILADAEICNGNIEAATNLLKQVTDDLYCVDHLMYARIEYQKKNYVKANKIFLQVREECKNNELLPWLAFKLKLSVELNNDDIFWLTSLPQHSTTTPIKAETPQNAGPNQNIQVIYGANRFVGSSNSTLLIKREIKEYAKVDMPILITGETGVGKEVVATALHEESKYSKEPFLPINCGAIVGTLLQSELFGHNAGAFTSAQKKHVGIFEAAGKGTVFLDEFGEISSETQVALLRVLETRRIRPIGTSHTRPIQCKIIVATNANLEDLIEKGKFRNDLYYRLKSFEIKVRPLRNRKKDIIDLALYFLNKNSTDNRCKIDLGARKLLSNYEWPGNTRELQNELQKIQILNSNKSNYCAADFSFIKQTKKSPASEKNTLSQAEPQALNDQILNSNHSDMDLAINYKSTHRRVQRIKELFLHHKRLRRIEIINTLKIAQSTATKDLQKLTQEGFIKKISPSDSPRTQYFELI